MESLTWKIYYADFFLQKTNGSVVNTDETQSTLQSQTNNQLI